MNWILLNTFLICSPANLSSESVVKCNVIHNTLLYIYFPENSRLNGTEINSQENHEGITLMLSEGPYINVDCNMYNVLLN